MSKKFNPIHIGPAARRTLAAGLAVCTALAAALPAGAAELAPTRDETYYATLDYYGGLMDSSVVKSIRTFGNPAVSDYGVYDEVINLTDSRPGTISGDKVTFDLTGNVPDKFYFEGKTIQPYAQFPWLLSLSYTLNGLPVRAEELAGEKGVVEITLHALPKPTASEYSKNNLVLTAMSMFNGDDILSLDAPGAQVQLFGNLYCVLYAVLPGEEQHFTIRVGTEDFTYSGMIFLAVPATLEQLDQVADLREAKEEAEDSYNAMLDSMHAILDSMEGMSGSLQTAASGLDQLNRARGTVSGGKDQVYADVDAALEAAAALAASLKPIASMPEPPAEGEGEASEEGTLPEGETPAPEAPPVKKEPTAPFVPIPASPSMSDPPAEEDQPETPEGPGGSDSEENQDPLSPAPIGHLTTAKRALKETNTLLNEMSGNLTSLRPEIEETRRILENIQKDLKELKSSSKRLNTVSKNLTRDLDDLEFSLDRLGNALGSTGGISSVSSIKINGMTVGQLNAAVNSAKDGYKTFQNQMAAMGDKAPLPATPEGFQKYLQSTGKTEAEAAQIGQLASGAYDSQLKQAGMVDGFIGDVNDKIDEVNNLIRSMARPAGVTMHDLADTVSSLRGLTDLLAHLSNGESIQPIENMQDVTDMALRVSEHVDTSLDQLEALTDIMNTYDPHLQQALSDTQTTVIAATSSLETLTAAAKSAEELLRQSGSDLDSGTKRTLSGVSASLRKAASGMDQTHTVRSAIDTVDSLVSDQWDSHTGEDNNLLLMDAGAPPVSLTDTRNQGTTSIQYIMRTQEITEKEAEEEPLESVEKDTGTIWSRIAAMFRDIWKAITGIFS